MMELENELRSPASFQAVKTDSPMTCELTPDLIAKSWRSAMAYVGTSAYTQTLRAALNSAFDQRYNRKQS
jgi:hypothetical protein